MPNDITAHEFSAEPPDYRQSFLYCQSIDLAAECFKLVQQLPEEERLNLVADILETSVKISSNIAGAYQEESRKRRLRHFDVARGKDKRLQTLVTLAVKVEYLKRPATTRARLLANEMDGWLRTLIKQLARSSSPE
jgi:four helix bundle protein